MLIQEQQKAILDGQGIDGAVPTLATRRPRAHRQCSSESKRLVTHNRGDFQADSRNEGKELFGRNTRRDASFSGKTCKNNRERSLHQR